MLRNNKKDYYYKFKCGNNVHVLENVDNVKDLGVTVDSSISFETHINEKVSKANSMECLIRRNVLYLDENMFNSLYKSQVRPHLEYAITAWHPHKQKHICTLENVQRRVTKYVPSLKGLSYSDSIKKLSLPTLTSRHAGRDTIEVYKIPNIYDKEVCPNISLNNQSIRGHCFKLKKNRAQKDIRQYYLH